MKSWWELDVVTIGGNTEMWEFDEEPEVFTPSAHRTTGYRGTINGQYRAVRIVLDNISSWTVSKVEEEE